ncbi:MAG: succinate dehydrogenase cytochrome b subunit [Firmicutes bacterium]|nr:succinate dehydrogenase cytochrome b subunit [Bacillota bacterium]
MAAAEHYLDGKGGFLASSIGKKIVMAVTGTILFLFVTVHMLGNMQAYLGPHAFNAYAELLHTSLHGAGIWIFRSVLLVAVLLHAWAALSLTLDNMKARPKGYREQQLWSATWASRTMRYSGVVLALFIIYHLLHLTTGQVHPSFQPGNAYANFVNGFSQVGASLFYIVAQLCLGLHLWHGIWSFTQTFGWAHPRYNKLRRTVATVFAVAIVLGNISFPIAVLCGVIR